MATAIDDHEEFTYQAETTSSIRLPLEELLGCSAVEKQRVEFKESWHNEKDHNRGTYWQVVHTITAFANDYYNENGGYIVIGVKENRDNSCRNWEPEVCGVEKKQLDLMQQQIYGACQGNIRPQYSPVISPEVYNDKHVLVLWAQAGDEGPYECREQPKGDKFKFYIRSGPTTCAAKRQEEQTLLMRKNKRPFDDRMARYSDSGKPVKQSEISFDIFSSFLNEVGSRLLRERVEGEKDKENLYIKNKLLIQLGDRLGAEGKLVPNYVPRNVSLLFFNEEPQTFYPGAKIELAWYKAKPKKVIDEKVIQGPVHQQIKECCRLILSKTQEEMSFACISYPEQALTEALVNAVYHRGYESQYPDPIKVHVSPNGISITSYPGPDSSLKEEDFKSGGIDIPLVPARNRRIGEMLKELKLAEMRGAGIPAIYDAMETNQNPSPKFVFNEKFFKASLPSHPVYRTKLKLSEIDCLVANGQKETAFKLLLEFIEDNQDANSEEIANTIYKHFPENVDHEKVQEYFKESKTLQNAIKRAPFIDELNKWGEREPLDISRGVEIIQKLVDFGGTQNDLKIAIVKANFLCEKTPLRLSCLQDAHRLFDAMGSEIFQSNSRAAFQYASCKFNIFFINRDEMTSLSQLDCLQKAEHYVNKAYHLTPEVAKSYCANQMRLLGEIKYWLICHKKATPKDVHDCFEKARKYNPNIRIRPWYTNPEELLHTKVKRKEAPKKNDALETEVQEACTPSSGLALGRGRGRGRGRGIRKNTTC